MEREVASRRATVRERLRTLTACLALLVGPACADLPHDEEATLSYAKFASIECGETSIIPLLDELPQLAHALELEDGRHRILFWGEHGAFRWDRAKLGVPPASVAFHGARHGALLLIDAEGRVTDWAYIGPDGYRRLRVESLLGRE